MHVSISRLKNAATGCLRTIIRGKKRRQNASSKNHRWLLCLRIPKGFYQRRSDADASIQAQIAMRIRQHATYVWTNRAYRFANVWVTIPPVTHTYAPFDHTPVVLRSNDPKKI